MGTGINAAQRRTASANATEFERATGVAPRNSSRVANRIGGAGRAVSRSTVRRYNREENRRRGR